MTQNMSVKAPKRKKIASLEKRKARGGWLFVLPFVIGFVLIYLPLLLDSIRYSFCEVVRIQGVTHFTFVGWANYKEALFVDPDFVEVLIKGIGQMFFDIPMILIFSLFMAVLLNQKMVGRAAFRAIFFVPVILATGLVDTAMQGTYSAMDSGMAIEDGASEESAADQIVNVMDVQRLFQGMAIGDGLLNYVTQAINNIYDIVNRSGVQMLIFLAGLQSISPAIYESVSIDGATAWETFWKITFPMISPMILVNAVYTIIDSFTAGSNKVMSFISSAYKGQGGQVLSSAMSWIYFGVVILIVAAVAGIASSLIFYRKR